MLMQTTRVWWTIMGHPWHACHYPPSTQSSKQSGSKYLTSTRSIVLERTVPPTDRHTRTLHKIARPWSAPTCPTSQQPKSGAHHSKPTPCHPCLGLRYPTFPTGGSPRMPSLSSRQFVRALWATIRSQLQKRIRSTQKDQFLKVALHRWCLITRIKSNKTSSKFEESPPMFCGRHKTPASSETFCDKVVTPILSETLLNK